MIDFQSQKGINALALFQSGQALAKQQQAEKALGTLALDPNDNSAFARLAQYDPEKAYQIGGQRQKAQGQQRIASRVASGDYQGASQEAIGSGNYDAVSAIGKLNEQQQKQVAEHADVLGSVSIALKGVPQAQRAAQLQAMAPQLLARGIKQEEILGADITDAGLDGYIAMATQAKDAISAWREQNAPYTLAPQSQRYGPGGKVIAENRNTPERYIANGDGTVTRVAPTYGAGGGAAPSGNPDAVWQNMIEAESGGRQFGSNGAPLTSPKGAVGIAQVMPATAPEAARLAGVPFDEQRYRTDPAYNQQLGRAYYEEQLRKYGGDPEKAAAAYNAGSGRVDGAIQRGGENWRQYLPQETRSYINRVTGSGQQSAGGPQVQRIGTPKQKDAPSGYRWEGERLTAIPGGPADPSGATTRNVESNRKAEAGFRKEFDGLPEVKTFKTARQQYNALRNIAGNPNATAQDDIAAIFSFMKTLDPTSTVREGEFATAQNAAGVPDSLRNAFNRARDGQRLNTQQRKEMIATAYRSYTSFRDAYNQTAENYRGYAKDSGVNPDRVARTYTPDRPAANPAQGNRMSQFRVIR